MAVEGNVTEYRRCFFVSNKKEEEEAHFATLSIPNVIDKTYTGVLCINATLKFYERVPKRWENETSNQKKKAAFFRKCRRFSNRLRVEIRGKQ